MNVLAKTNTYQIKIDSFEGPLDLLLHLIEEQKLDITKVSLARVTEQYLALLHDLQSANMHHLIDFLVVASELMVIKSSLLLPVADQVPREPEEESNLLERLREFQKFKQAAREIGEMLARGERYFTRQVKISAPQPESSKLPASVTLQSLAQLMRHVIDRTRPAQELEQRVLEPRLSLHEKIDLITTNLKRLRTTRFSHMIQRDELKIDVIVSFLAMLELVKQQLVDAHQSDLFAEIELSVQ